MDAARTLLEFARKEIQDRDSARDAHWRNVHEVRADAFYLSAYIAAGMPDRCDEFPGYAVWSARETMRRAA